MDVSKGKHDLALLDVSMICKAFSRNTCVGGSFYIDLPSAFLPAMVRSFWAGPSHGSLGSATACIPMSPKKKLYWVEVSKHSMPRFWIPI